VDREVFDKRGVLFAKSLYRTTYQCAACRHRWSVMQADEYREPTRRCEKPQRG
jgi:DNA replicative helicase MCM subunit Mcm2 (Cdc46/Mcm family)